MPGTTGPRIGLVWGYTPGDDGWGVGAFNPNFAKLETLVQTAVQSVANDPPGSPTNGETYIVGTAPTGAWVGHAAALAVWYTIGTPAWLYLTAAAGYRVYNVATTTYWHYSGTAWVEEHTGNLTGPVSSTVGNLPSYADAIGDTLDDSGIPTAAVLQKSGTLTFGHFLSADATGKAVDSGVAAGSLGTGDVTGPAGAVSGNLSSYGSTTGKAIADSGIPASGVLQKTGALTSGHLLAADASGKAVDSGVAATGIGTGDVTGPASAVVGNVATYGSTTGKAIVDGAVLLTALLQKSGTLTNNHFLSIDATGKAVDSGVVVGAGTVPAGTSQYDTLVWSGSAWQVQRPRWGVGAYVPLVLTASQDLLYHRFDAATTIPANFGAYLGHASQAGGSAVAAASTVITVSKALSASPTSFSSVGSITFAAGTMTPTFSSSGAITFAAGDILRLQAPATPDATFAGFFATLVGFQT